jgi:hypothetical protein
MRKLSLDQLDLDQIWRALAMVPPGPAARGHVPDDVFC